MSTEPSLQPLDGEHFRCKTTNTEVRDRLDVVAEIVWGHDQQNVFFDVRVFNPFASCHRNSSLAQNYWKK